MWRGEEGSETPVIPLIEIEEAAGRRGGGMVVEEVVDVVAEDEDPPLPGHRVHRRHRLSMQKQVIA